MLSATAYTLRQKARLAVSLAWVGGFVDAVGFLLIASFTSNMTGNTALLAARVAKHEWAGAGYFGFLVLMFLAATLSGVLTVGGKRRGVRSIFSLWLGVEAVLLGVFVLTHDWMILNEHFMLLGALPCVAMGLQNATITQIGGSVVRTTHVTGVLTDLGLEGVQFIFWFRDRTRGRFLQRLKRAFRISPRHPSLQRLLLLTSIWASFLFGVIFGATAWGFFGMHALVAPVVFLLFLIVLDFIRPIGTMQRVIHGRHDAELKKFGIDPGMVPPNVAVYRVKSNGANKVPRPDLGRLADDADRKLRVFVLLLSGDIELDENSLLGLHNTLGFLRGRRCELVLCTMDSPQYAQIQRSVFGDELGEANLCSDPEFALARAIELSAGHG